MSNKLQKSKKMLADSPWRRWSHAPTQLEWWSMMEWWDVIVDQDVIIQTTCTGDLGSSNEYLVLLKLFDPRCWISIRATTKASLDPGAVYSVSSWFLRSKCEMKESSPATSSTLILKNEIPQSISFCERVGVWSFSFCLLKGFSRLLTSHLAAGGLASMEIWLYTSRFDIVSHMWHQHFWGSCFTLSTGFLFTCFSGEATAYAHPRQGWRLALSNASPRRRDPIHYSVTRLLRLTLESLESLECWWCSCWRRHLYLGAYEMVEMEPGRKTQRWRTG